MRTLFKQCAHSWRGFPEGLLQFALFTVLRFKSSMKKHCLAEILQGIRDKFLHENNRNYKFSYKFTFIPFLSFYRNRKQDSNFQQVGGLVTRNIFAFCLQRVALHFKGIPNSIYFYKRIFLHVIPARIIVPWITSTNASSKNNSKSSKGVCISSCLLNFGMFTCYAT